MKNTLPKAERLYLNRQIEELFESNSSFYVAPFKVLHKTHIDQSAPNCRILISVSKKKLKKAVDRNLIKRRIREAYRLNKHACIEFLKQNGIKINISLIYTFSDILTYEEIESKIIVILNRLISNYANSSNKNTDCSC